VTTTAAEDDGWLQARDGLRLFWRRWRPQDPRAVMLVVHGLGEHSGRYLHLGSHFSERGFVVLALDYRGHGRSDGPRVHVECFDEFVEDLALLRDKARAEYPSLPLLLVGHSQGGLVVLRSALQSPEALAGAIVSSPLLGVHPSSRPGPLLEAASRVLSSLAPGLRVPNNVDARLVSRDPSVVEAYRRDPLVSRRVSSRWFTSLLEAIDDTFERAPWLRVPLLLMSSGGDRLVDPEAAARWASRAPSGLVEYVRWDGLYHEMFNEPEQAAVFARMLSWWQERSAGPVAVR
jgi:acylglycerol lipase